MIPVVAFKGFSKADFNSTLKILAVAVLKLRRTKVLEIKKAALTAKDRAAFARVLKALGMKSDHGIFDNLLKNELRNQVEGFAPEFRKAVAQLRQDTESVSADQRAILGPVLTLMAKPESEPAFATLQKVIGGLNEPAITRAFIGAVKEAVSDETPEQIETKLAAIVKRLTKKAGGRLTGEEKKAAKAIDPEAVKEYDALQAKLKLSNKTMIRSAVAESGKSFILLQAYARWMKAQGVKKTTIHPALFKSKFIGINLDGELTDNRGVKLVGGGDINNHQNEVTVNPNYKPDATVRGNNWIYACKSTNPRSGNPAINRAQPEDVVAERRNAKFERVSVGSSGIEAMKKKWRSKMRATGKIDDEATVYPFFAEYLFQTASRVGSSETGMSAGAATYGASNFLVKHVGKGSKLVLTYPVKAGKIQKFLIDATGEDGDDGKAMKMLAAFLRKKIEGKKSSDFVWTVGGKRMNVQLFNKYLHSLGVKLKNHDFRSLRGTQIATEALAKAQAEVAKLQKSKGKKLAASDVNGLFMEAIKEVGAKLGHVRRAGGAESVTPATAIGSYVNPKIMVDWYKQAGFVPPTQVLKAAKKSGIAV